MESKATLVPFRQVPRGTVIRWPTGCIVAKINNALVLNIRPCRELLDEKGNLSKVLPQELEELVKVVDMRKIFYDKDPDLDPETNTWLPVPEPALPAKKRKKKDTL